MIKQVNFEAFTIITPLLPYIVVLGPSIHNGSCSSLGECAAFFAGRLEVP